MENKPNYYRICRVASFLRKNKNKKVVSLDYLSSGIGFYSDVLSNDLVYFEPMIRMDPTLNMQNLLPSLVQYVEEEKKARALKPKKPRQIARKKEVSEYKDYVDFIYRKMTGPGGLLSLDASLSDHDLHVLEVLLRNEKKKRNKAKSAKKER